MLFLAGLPTSSAAFAALLLAGNLHISQECTVFNRERARLNETVGNVQLQIHENLSFRGLNPSWWCKN